MHELAYHWLAHSASAYGTGKTGSVALLIDRRNFPVRALTRSSWTDYSCQRRKLVGKRHRLGAVDYELALADHVYQFDAREHGAGGAE